RQAVPVERSLVRFGDAPRGALSGQDVSRLLPGRMAELEGVAIGRRQVRQERLDQGSIEVEGGWHWNRTGPNRGPSARIRSRNADTASSAPASRIQCVMRWWALSAKTNPSGVASRQV